MLIVLVTNHFFPYSTGGVEVLAKGLATSYQSRGHEVKILCSISPTTLTEQKPFIDEIYQDIFVRRIPVSPENRSLITKVYDPNLIPILEETFSHWQPDVVHILTMVGFSSAVIIVAKKYAQKVFYTSTGYELFCSRIELIKTNGNLCNGWASFAKCYNCCRPQNLRSMPFYLMTAWMSETQLSKFKSKTEQLLQRKYPIESLKIASELHARRTWMTYILRFLDHIIAPSNWVKQTLIWNGVEENRISVVQHGVDPLVIGNGDKTYSNQIRFGYIGRLVKLKGVDLLIQAFLKLSKETYNASLKIFGPASEDEKNYYNFCQQIGQKDTRITFHGILSREQMSKIFSEIDVLVVPSGWHEVLGIIVQEGLANLTPVIGSRIGGIQELIHHNINGLLFSVNDKKALLDCLQKCCDPLFLSQLRLGIKPTPTVSEEANILLTLYANQGKDNL